MNQSALVLNTACDVSEAAEEMGPVWVVRSTRSTLSCLRRGRCWRELISQGGSGVGGGMGGGGVGGVG